MGQGIGATCDCDVIHEEVVIAVRQQMPPEDDMRALADLYKVFADKTRLQILFALGTNEMCVCDLAVLLGMTKSAISHQLKQLRLANLVRNRKQGKVVYYSLSDHHIREIFESGFEHIRE